MTDEQKAQHDSDYKELLALYIALLRALRDGDAKEALYDLAALRTDIAFRHVVTGLGIDVDEALNLLKNRNDSNLTKHDKDMTDRIDAAIANLIDFSVCEEYQLYDETLEELDGGDIEFESDEYYELLALCEKYNDSYSAVENADIEYSGAMALMWMSMSARDWVVYWTQNDSKVRPWHLALQGYAAPMDEFPSWMIPPIEYNCRCFLEVLEVGTIAGKLHSLKTAVNKIRKPKELKDGVYSESLAKCGRIFGASHNYFKVKEKDKEMLQGFVERLKEKYYGS